MIDPKYLPKSTALWDDGKLDRDDGSYVEEDPMSSSYDPIVSLWAAIEGLTSAIRLLQEEQDRRYKELRETATQLERALIKMGARFDG